MFLYPYTSWTILSAYGELFFNLTKNVMFILSPVLYVERHKKEKPLTKVCENNILCEKANINNGHTHDMLVDNLICLSLFRPKITQPTHYCYF